MQQTNLEPGQKLFPQSPPHPCEQLLPERECLKTYHCSCTKPRLDELASLEQDTLSSKRNSSA
ncbi:hypothetical protein DEO72_LG10g3636 [Vigna unguiculata]|uniref:Uncharacterized protein n=1 Tax=Vigna unguiculata TaxID=3917 RepID=A0A4D6NIA4_VIGUN|nr:hypothetical protein DEO72_LG10g3636 [Vigna unguiculata]